MAERGEGNKTGWFPFLMILNAPTGVSGFSPPPSGIWPAQGTGAQPQRATQSLRNVRILPLSSHLVQSITRFPECGGVRVAGWNVFL